jgi:hypothetical protein
MIHIIQVGKTGRKTSNSRLLCRKPVGEQPDAA